MDNTYKLIIWITYHFGLYKLDFSKSFILPFVPTLDIDLMEENSGRIIEFSDIEYPDQKHLMYNMDMQRFEISINYRTQKHSNVDFDELLEIYKNNGWGCHNTNFDDIRRFLIMKNS